MFHLTALASTHLCSMPARLGALDLAKTQGAPSGGVACEEPPPREATALNVKNLRELRKLVAKLGLRLGQGARCLCSYLR